MQKAYSVLTEKAFSEDAEFVYLEGIASTPTPDKVGDIVEPMGARFKTPMPLLLQHDHQSPVGHVTFAEPNEKGIPFKAQLPIVKEPGLVQDRVNSAIHSLKYALISAVSIGFQPVAGATEVLKGGGFRFKEWAWHELSLVVIGAADGAIVTAIKSIDQQHLAPASGPAADPAPPGVTGTPKAAPRGPVKLIPRGNTK